MEALIKSFMSIEQSDFGYGYGYGDGDGRKSKVSGNNDEQILEDYRKGFLNKEVHSFKSFNKKPVYYIDNIPCIFLSIVGNLSKVEVIKDDMTIQKMYIAKAGNLFAHGNTKEQALQDVTNKFLSSLSFEQKKKEFIKMFKKDETYPTINFFEWHYFLTGSCESGRTMFVKSNGIDLDGEMTTLDFLNLTKNEYNGNVIKDILNDVK